MTYRKAEIRPFRPEDEPLLFGLASLDRGADRRTLSVLERETVFVAELEDSPAGYVALERRAEGIGRQLLEWAEGFSIAAGAAKLQVVVEADNRRALEFYRGRGFTSAGDDLLELELPHDLS
jgi:GNAT superfamily N-acetyltransferase